MNNQINKTNYICNLFFGITTFCTIISSANFVSAQIIPDKTLPNNSQVGIEGNITKIEGGTTNGGNLFHSFEKFGVSTGGEAYFNNAVDIQNIIGRVTGNSISNIDGLIKANGTANLFLINPNGIVFGENARLDIGGSFLGSTADAIGFGEDNFFSASNPDSSSLLKINPSALFFNQVRAASIQNNSGLNLLINISKGLRVSDDNSLLLVGGDINMNGGELYASGGRVELGGVAGKGTVELNGNGNNLSLTIPDGVEKSNITLANGAGVNVSAGDININANNLKVENEAGVGVNDGDININANNFTLTNGARVKVDDGDMNITVNNLKVENGTQVKASTYYENKGGNLNVDAQDVQLIGKSNGQPYTMSQDGTGLYTYQEFRDSTGDEKGNLTIKTNSLLVKDGAEVNINFFMGKGKAGNLNIEAKDIKLIGEESRLHSYQISFYFEDFQSQLNGARTSRSSIEVGGNIGIETDNLLIKDGAYINTVTNGTARKGGNLTVKAKDIQLIGEIENILPFYSRTGTGNLNDFGSGLYTQAEDSSIGDAGDLTIKTDSLLIKDGGRASSSTFGSSNGGNLTVEAQDIQLIGGSKNSIYYSGLFSSTGNPSHSASGDAGNITIKTNTLLAKDGGQVNASTFGSGKGGDLTVEAQDIQLIGISQNPKLADTLKWVDVQFRSGLYTQAEGSIYSEGDAGNITIKTNNLLVKDGAQVNASTSTGGKGGNLIVDAQDIQLISGGKNAQFVNELYNQHLKYFNDRNTKLGAIVYPVDKISQYYSDLYTQDDSGLYTAQGSRDSTGNAGNLTIRTDNLQLEDGAKVSVQSLGTGIAGNLDITADSIKLDKGSNLATTESTNGGNINLNIAELLIMRNGSQISTTAGGAGAGGNGGNININIPNGFIVATPNQNNDITANAFEGNGGRVTINAAGIFGMIPRSREELVNLLGTNDPKELSPSQLPTNDITAISQQNPDLSGNVEIITPQTDPTSGSIQFPTIPVDTEIVDACSTPGYAQSSFTITGKGSLPPSPLKPLTGRLNRTKLATLNENEAIEKQQIQTRKKEPSIKPIVEARGWVRTPEGKIILVAYNPQNTNFQTINNSGNCNL